MAASIFSGLRTTLNYAITPITTYAPAVLTYATGAACGFNTLKSLGSCASQLYGLRELNAHSIQPYVTAKQVAENSREDLRTKSADLQAIIGDTTSLAERQATAHEALNGLSPNIGPTQLRLPEARKELWSLQGKIIDSNTQKVSLQLAIPKIEEELNAFIFSTDAKISQLTQECESLNNNQNPSEAQAARKEEIEREICQIFTKKNLKIASTTQKIKKLKIELAEYPTEEGPDLLSKKRDELQNEIRHLEGMVDQFNELNQDIAQMQVNATALQARFVTQKAAVTAAKTKEQEDRGGDNGVRGILGRFTTTENAMKARYPCATREVETSLQALYGGYDDATTQEERDLLTQNASNALAGRKSLAKRAIVKEMGINILKNGLIFAAASNFVQSEYLFGAAALICGYNAAMTFKGKSIRSIQAVFWGINGCVELAKTSVIPTLVPEIPPSFVASAASIVALPLLSCANVYCAFRAMKSLNMARLNRAYANDNKSKVYEPTTLGPALQRIIEKSIPFNSKKYYRIARKEACTALAWGTAAVATIFASGALLINAPESFIPNAVLPILTSPYVSLATAATFFFASRLRADTFAPTIAESFSPTV